MAQGTKQIGNAGQAFALGGTWGTPSIDNSGTTTFTELINNTGLTLYFSDIVVVDATGTLANLSSSAGDPTVIGVVGDGKSLSVYPSTGTFPTIDSSINVQATGGNNKPFTDAASRTEAMGFTNGSETVTDTAAVATDLGRTIITPYNSSTNATPQILTITAVSVGTGYTVSANFTGTTGTFTCTIQDSGPAPGYTIPPGGWGNTSAFPPGSVVPIITRGFGYVNINGVAGVVAKDAISVGNGTVVGARTADGSITTAGIGRQIATTLQAYAARNQALSTMTVPITGHDCVAAIIGKF